ncbi:MAG: peptide-binding protein [Methylocystaceae bacterium]|nr:MAG: peptide-binding protein [Methylocystaceae bacterium]
MRRTFLGSFLFASSLLFYAVTTQAAPKKILSGQSAVHHLGNDIPMIPDADRVLLEVTFETPQGGARKALVWFNMGMAQPVLTKALYRELGIDKGRPLRLTISDRTIDVPPDAVVDGDGGIGVPEFRHLFAPKPVEAMLPARIVQKFVVTLDYGHRTFAISESGARKPDGVAVPCEVNTKTGIVAITTEVGDGVYPFAVDAGAGYSWMRGDVARAWLVRHPDWRRAFGAVGPANANMVDFAFEKDGVVFRIPRIEVGALTLDNVGVLATAPVIGAFVDGLFGDFFWDNWSKAAPAPVIGWLGGNVLKDYILTIDYPDRTTYWRKQRTTDLGELNQPSVTLVRRDDHYFIGGFVRKADSVAAEESLQGVEIGDELVAIDGADIRSFGREAVLSKLHGVPGSRRRLQLERSGGRVDIDTAIIGFD